MTQHRPIWIDNSSRDPERSRAFYGQLFGWQSQVSPDPQYGGYAVATLDGQAVAGFGGVQDPSMPDSTWALYISTPDVEETLAAATAAGGEVMLGAMPVGAMGTMAFLRDPSGAVIGLWQPDTMTGFTHQGPGGYGWAELNARGVDAALPFYEQTFGWTRRTGSAGPDTVYNELLDGEESLLGAWEMPSDVPPMVPSYWMIYFAVDDIEATHDAAVAAGADSMVRAMDFPGGTFSILADPQGGVFGIIRIAE